ncbi:MAG: hypothetical protein IPN22_00275 [Bacteroidetes bacterium]|nr:hypothetical protein [Bacteroidota bacterium]
MTNTLPPHSTTWIYQSNRLLTDTEALEIREKAKQFAKQWTAHKMEVAGDGDVLYNLFVVLMADEQVTGVSGCSIDASVHFIKSLERDYHLSFFTVGNIAYLLEGKAHLCSLKEFRSMIDSGALPADTLVFENMLSQKQQLIDSWIKPYNQSRLKNVHVPEPLHFTL